MNCSSDLKIFANSRHSASNFKSFSPSVQHFFLTVGQNNFGNKIPKTKHFFFKIMYIFFQISRRLHALSYYSFLFKHCLIGNSICLFLMTGILNKKWAKSGQKVDKKWTKSGQKVGICPLLFRAKARNI